MPDDLVAIGEGLNDQDVRDNVGHGTHCAATICAATVGDIRFGVAPGVVKLCDREPRRPPCRGATRLKAHHTLTCMKSCHERPESQFLFAEVKRCSDFLSLLSGFFHRRIVRESRIRTLANLQDA